MFKAPTRDIAVNNYFIILIIFCHLAKTLISDLNNRNVYMLYNKSGKEVNKKVEKRLIKK